MIALRDDGAVDAAAELGAVPEAAALPEDMSEQGHGVYVPGERAPEPQPPTDAGATAAAMCCSSRRASCHDGQVGAMVDGRVYARDQNHVCLRRECASK